MKFARTVQRTIATVVLLVFGGLSFGGCRSRQAKDTQPEPVNPPIDTLRVPIGQAVAMYGTPYRRYEVLESVSDEGMQE